MQSFNYIEFKKERDLGAIISDTFKFIRENWKEYFLSVIKIIGPFLLIGAVLLIYSFMSYSKATKGMMTVSSDPYQDPNNIFGNMMGMFSWVVIMMLIWGLVYTLLAEVSLYYIKSYIANNGKADFNEVKSNTYKNLWKFIGLGILSILMMAVGYVLCFFPFFYIAVVLFLAMPIMVFETKNIGDTIGHCFTLIKGEWWNTFGVLIVVGLLVGVLGMAFSIPTMIYQLVSTGISIQNEDPTALFDIFTDPIYLALTGLAYFGKFLLYSITLIASAFIYYDLNERKNLTGTFERIDSLGKD